MAKQKGIHSRPNKGEHLELAHQTKCHCINCENLRLIQRKKLHSGKLVKDTHASSSYGNGIYAPGYLGLYKSGTSIRITLITKDQGEGGPAGCHKNCGAIFCLISLSLSHSTPLSLLPLLFLFISLPHIYC